MTLVGSVSDFLLFVVEPWFVSLSESVGVLWVEDSVRAFGTHK